MRHFFVVILHFFILFAAFFVGRCCFIVANFSYIDFSQFSEVARAFLYSMRLDLSAACYIMPIPLLMIALHCAFAKKWLLTALKIFFGIVIFAYALVVFADIAVYGEWATKLNYKALQYLNHPTEVVRSASAAHTLTVILGTLIFSSTFIFIYNKFILYPIETQKDSMRYLIAVVMFVFGEPLLFAGIRGGFQQIPISQSAAYFSKNQILNDAAVNPVWNLGHSVLNFNGLNKGNPYMAMDSEEAERIVARLNYAEKDSSVNVLKINPEEVNVVIILLESWSADLIESLTGQKGITPFFHSLEQQGILFTNFYANGHRSQLGISALLSGFPPVPDLSITDNIEKYPKLNSIIKDVNNRYSTSFWFGGDLTYGNLRAYLVANQFDAVYGEEAFPKNLPRGKLSIFDRYSLDYYVKELKNENKPFFSIFFTASTHSPYDEPKEVEQLEWDCVELPYLNSAKYTDDCLREFFEKAQKEDWYSKTLFVLVADHSHQTQLKRNYYSSEYQRVPMLWVGNVLKDEYRGTTIDNYCSHIDISKTILRQLGFEAEKYIWSQDIMNPYSQNAVPVEIPSGLGWITPEGFLRYDGYQKSVPTIVGYDNVSPQQLESAKKSVAAYLQVLYNQYLDM